MSPVAREENLRHFFQTWGRRIHCAEKAEAHLLSPLPMATRGGRRGNEGRIQWVQCCNIYCGKWRALLAGMDVSRVVGPDQPWYCFMNSWDESLASCGAPQEHGYSIEELFPP
ncbi:unnamed protein product, partial [Choristocarpus tenellus]